MKSSLEPSITIILKRPGIEEQTHQLFYNDIGILTKDWQDVTAIMDRAVD